MLFANIVTIICLALMIIEIAGVIIKLVFANRSQRISFIRGFKKGKFAIIYLTSFPLYCVAHIYQGEHFFKAFFNSINEIKDLVVLNYKTDGIALLMNDSHLFRDTVYLCFVIASVNALMFAVSILNQYLWERFQRFIGDITSNDRLYIFGNSEQSLSIYESDTKRYKIVIDDIPAKDKEKLYLKKIRYVSTVEFSEYASKLIDITLKRDSDGIAVINMNNDNLNITICKSFVERMHSLEEAQREKLFSHLSIYVYGDPEYESIYEDVVSMGYGCIHYLNKYQMMAHDFIDRYPISRFLNESHIDYSTSLIRDNVDINVFLFGFGKTNRQIFLGSVVNNQFLCGSIDAPIAKQVNYHIFDKHHSDSSKDLNHSYYRYKREFEGADASEYLPLPALPANEIYYDLDWNDSNFYNRIREILISDKKGVNLAVVALGSDLENIDVSKKLAQKCEEWGIGDLTIFIKASGWHGEQNLLNHERCIFIGNEKEVVYNIGRITDDKIVNMARLRDEIYELEYAIKHSTNSVIDDEYILKNRMQAQKNWYTVKTQMERDSSIYSCLSIRSKLNLMGLDYCEKGSSDRPALTREEYLEHYAKEDMPEFDKYGNSNVTGKPIAYYSLDFPISRRRNMAILEHQRWNSFMISKGMVPSSLAQIVGEQYRDAKGRIRYTNGKKYSARRHGNLTTFDGLVEFRRLIARRDGTNELDTDVIKYDYQILDDAWWLLNSSGNDIVKIEQ